MTRRLPLIAPVIAACCAMSIPASAKTAADVLDDIRGETRDFANCIAAKKGARANELLAMTIGSADYRRAMTILLRQSGCSKDPDTASMEPLVLSGALAEIALRQGNAAQIAARVASANPDDKALTMADCAVRADRARANALLATKWLSDEEREAAFEMGPVLKPCAGADPMRLTPAQIRALVALATLRTSAV